jgi:hypothetical protein
MDAHTKNQRDLESLDTVLRDMTRHLDTIPFFERTARDGELANIRAIVVCNLDMVDEIPEDELASLIDSLHTRLQRLLSDPGSAGLHDEIIADNRE